MTACMQIARIEPITSLSAFSFQADLGKETALMSLFSMSLFKMRVLLSSLADAIAALLHCQGRMID